jgi:inorganic pyrophosphatase/exopolyphosphatase
LAIPKGKFNQTKVIDSVVKEFSLGGREVSVVPVRRTTSEVKITSDDPGGCITGIVSREILEEKGFGL